MSFCVLLGFLFGFILSFVSVLFGTLTVIELYHAAAAVVVFTKGLGVFYVIFLIVISLHSTHYILKSFPFI